MTYTVYHTDKIVKDKDLTPYFFPISSDVTGSLQEIEECCVISINREYGLTCIASTGDVVVGILMLDS